MAQKFTITAELNLQTKNIGQVVDNLKKQFQGADLNIKIKDLAKAESQMRGLSKTTGEAERSVSSLGGSIATAAKKFSAITLATGTLIGFTRAIKNAVSDAIEFEREIVKIAQATGKTVGQLKSLQNEVSSVASSLGVSSKELILAARSLTQAGFAADKVTGALRVLAQTEVAATFDSIADTTEGAIALLNQFGRAAQRTGSEVEFLERSLSAINQVSKDFAVESSDLITAVRTTGSAFESAGGSLNELLALFTSVRSTTRESAESIATGFRTIFTRVQRVDTINALRNLGIELQDVEGKFVGPMEAISGNTIIYVESDLTLKHNNNKISEKFYVNEFDEKRVKEWETLFNSEKISLLKKLFGEEELSKFSKKPRNERYILDYFDYK
jgi:predicted  nucleic acid-binding Zn-ribbon protein